MLKIFLFGRIRLQHEQSTLDVKITPIVQALLAYLLIQPRRTYSRDALMELGWGDRPQDQARSCLNTALWRLRNILEPDGVRRGAYLLTGQAGEVAFNWDGDFWMDMNAFQAAARPILATGWEVVDDRAAQLLEQVTQLYHGDLLEGLYYDWALEERERMRAMYLNCLSYLLHYYRAHDHLEQAIATGQKILRHDPLREEVHRDLISIFVKNGQRALAVQQYELCCAALQNELGIGPMPETRALYEQILVEAQGETSPVDPPRAAPPNELAQAAERLNHILADLDAARQEIKRTLALLKRVGSETQPKNR